MNAIAALWWRDMLRFRREPTRWLGVVAQPLLFWIIIGSGMSPSFRNPGASDVSYLEFFFPGTLVMCVLFTTIFASISIIEDRQAGFLQSVLVAPSPRSSIVFGKIAGVTSLALMQSALFLVVAPAAHYPFGGIAWGMLLSALLLGCFALAGLNFAMAWVLNSSQGFHAVMSVALIPLWILSGAMFPLEGSPLLTSLAVVNPMSYLVSALRIALSGHAHASSDTLPALVAHQFLGLGVFAVLMVGVAIYAVNRSEEKA